MLTKLCWECEERLTAGDFLPVLKGLASKTDLELHVITSLVAENDMLCAQCDTGSKNHFAMLNHHVGATASL